MFRTFRAARIAWRALWARFSGLGRGVGRLAGAILGLALAGLLLSRASQAVSRHESPYAPLAQLARALVLVENLYVEPVERGRLLEGAIKGMVAELDPHSAYLPPRDFDQFQQDTRGRFVGIGVEVDTREGVITVLSPIEGSPAEKAGIRAGDKIVAVDAWSTRGQTIDRVVDRIRGEAGTQIRLTVQRPRVQLLFDVVVTRGEVKVSSVVAKRMARNVGYLRIKQFQRGTHEEFLRGMAAIRQEGDGAVDALVLDMRTNPGGLVDEAMAVADELMDGGTIFTTRSRGRVVDEVVANGGGAAARLPLVVLVNEFTASAAELVAGAVQDHARGVVVGARTFGKGSVQSVVELPDGAALKLTTTLYFTPSGRTLQAEGVLPHVVVQQRPQAGGMPIVRERDIEGHLPSERE
ncbi:MAG: S41 family peptidase, partial [Polyangiaceae bacterium]|nr:S41 family peptidase [Polyangiaceae bacterium]